MITSHVLQLRGSLAEAEQAVRYLWAAQIAKDRRVLDVRCGTGEGAELLAEAGAAEVVGLDNREAVVEAASNRAHANLRFERGEFKRLPFAAESFDLITCFDVLDHVADVDGLVAELRRVLRGDGDLCVSWRLPLEIEDSLRRQWPRVKSLEQERLLGSALPAGKESAWLVRRLAPKSGGRSFVALAGAAERQTPPPVAALGGGLDLSPRPDRETDGHLRELTAMRAERNELRARLIEAEALGERIVQLERDLEDSERWRGRVESERDHAWTVLDDVLGSLSWRVTRPLRALKRRLR